MMQQLQDRRQTLRIALWTPLPPQKTGIADYVADLLPYLSEYWDVEIFIDEGVIPESTLKAHYKIFPYTMYPERAAMQPFDLHVYQMGNNYYHWFIYQQALRVPGLVVLHDLSLAYMLYDALAGREADLEMFLEELRYAEGEEAVAEFLQYFNLGDHQGVMHFFSSHLMLRRLVERSYGLVTHLEFNATRLREQYPQAPFIHSMYLAVKDPYTEVSTENFVEWRTRVGLPPDALVVASFGFIQPTKQNDITIKAFARLAQEVPHARLVFVGQLNPAGGYDEYLHSLVKELGISDRVTFTGYVSRQEMLHYLLACDVVVNLRYPSFGEMSASLARAIAAGKPVLITDLPEWQFLPETFSWRVPPEENAVEVLAQHLLHLAHEETLRREMGRAARSYYETYGTPEKAAEVLNHLVHEVIAQVVPHLDLRPLDESPMQPLEVRLQRQIQRHLEIWTRTLQAGKWGQRFWRYRRWPIVGPLGYGLYRMWHRLRFYRAERRAFVNLQTALLNSVLRMLDLQRAQRAVMQDLQHLQRAVTWQTFPPLRVVERPLRKLESLPSAASEQDLEYWVEQGKKVTGGTYNVLSMRHKEHFYHALEESFRGTYEQIQKRQTLVWEHLKPLLPSSTAPVLDLGCGRGEFLHLLKDQGMPAYGVELDASRVEMLQDQGIKVLREDALTHLRALPTASLRAIVAFHVVEHLEFEYLMALLVSAKRALVPGGILYLETPNALSLTTLGHFYTDPTHLRPIPPYFLAFLLHYVGFDVPQMLFLQPEPAFGTWSHDQWMRYYQDYGVIGRKEEF